MGLQGRVAGRERGNGDHGAGSAAKMTNGELCGFPHPLHLDLGLPKLNYVWLNAKAMHSFNFND